MGKKLKVNKFGKECIDELRDDYPSLKPYYDEVADKVGCSYEEMVILEVHPDWVEEDEEGWDIRSFFPRGVNLEITELYPDYGTEDFSIGLVLEVKYEGKTFIAETNASPYILYANPQNIQ